MHYGDTGLATAAGLYSSRQYHPIKKRRDVGERLPLEMKCSSEIVLGCSAGDIRRKGLGMESVSFKVVKNQGDQALTLGTQDKSKEGGRHGVERNQHVRRA